MIQHAVLALLVQIAMPPPRGFVSDFAGVVDVATVARMDSVIQRVRDLTRGDIAVVTLSNISGREAADVALQIGREWGVGGTGEVGDPARNLGGIVERDIPGVPFIAVDGQPVGASSVGQDFALVFFIENRRDRTIWFKTDE